MESIGLQRWPHRVAILLSIPSLCLRRAQDVGNLLEEIEQRRGDDIPLYRQHSQAHDLLDKVTH